MHTYFWHMLDGIAKLQFNASLFNVQTQINKRDNRIHFVLQDDTDVTGNILNVSFSARRPEAEIGVSGDTSQYYSPTHLRERVYLHRATLARLATVQVRRQTNQYIKGNNTILYSLLNKCCTAV